MSFQKSTKNILIAIINLFFVNFSFASNTTVSTLAALKTAYIAANPGDTIVVANGTYDWGQINLTNTNGSANAAWIVVKAQSLSGVVFSGTSYIQFSGTKVMLDGFRFANGNAGTNAVIWFRSSSSVFANYCRITNITIDNYNTPSVDSSLDNKWVSLYGTNNRVDHCTFINKSNSGATVVVWYDNNNYPAQSTSTYHRIDSNYFNGRSYMGGNGGESIRVGVSLTSRTNGFNTIEYNLFEGLTQTEPEVISNKSNFNTYRYNTFKNSNGGLTLRQGRYCSVYGNFFIVDDPTKTESYGVRIIDKGHKVFNNYFEGLLGNSGSLTAMRSPIVLYNGLTAANDTTNPVFAGGYFPADSCMVAFNTIVNCKGGSGINIGYTDNGANIYQPTGISFGNNLIQMATGQAVYTNPVNTLLTYSAEGNLYNAPNGLGISNTTGFSNTTLNFAARNNGILTAPSSVQDAAVNTALYTSLLNATDAQGQVRSAIYDVGCDELNGTGTVIAIPLDSSLVGAGKPVYLIQAISFPALPAKVYGDVDFTAGASASSGLTVSYTSSNAAVATIVSNQIHIVGVGTADITASQFGNATYYPAASVTQTLTVSKANQTISFAALPAAIYGGADFAAGATSSASLTVSYSSSNTSVATIVNNQIHIVGAGAADITASQAGDANYNAALSVMQTLTVSKATQTIGFATLPAKTYGDIDFAPGAASSASLTVSYSSSNTAVATIVSNQIHIAGAGTSVITASQSGDANYNAAIAVAQTLTVSKANQTISFAALPAKVYGNADFAPGATANSGLAVSYTSSNTAVATIVSNQIHIVGVGTAVITASQAGDANYNAATSVTQTLTVSKANQTITFATLPTKVYGNANFSPGAAASSGLTVSYTSSNTAVATIVSNQIHIVSAGTSVITASQVGDANYNAATSVTRTLTVSKASQSITFPTISTKVYGAANFSPGATASSGLTVSYTSSNTAVATIVSNQIHIVGAGTSTITASQAGNTNYNAAPSVNKTLTVSKASQTITFPSLPTKVAGNADFSPGATASSGLTVSYTSSNTAVATIVNNQIHIVGAGTSTITASQAGNTNYNAATSVAKTLTVTANRPAPVSAVVSNPVFSFYPNPVSSAFKIDYSVAATANVHMAILNLNGQLVQSCFTETKAAGQYSKIIQINNLPNGVYLGRLIRGNEVKMFKLVVAK